MPQSEIEKQFARACRTAGLEVEAEQYVGRYRPDFMIRDRKFIIELDGHDTHSSVDDRTRDVQRQRYLQRLGWTVIRFTGREIYRDADACVSEVLDHLAAFSTPAPDYAIYIDWLFLQRSFADFERRNLAHIRHKDAISRDSVIAALTKMTDAPDAVAVHLFGRMGDFSESQVPLETARHPKGEGRVFVIEEHQTALCAVDLLEHLEAHRPVYGDRVILVADDGAYPPDFIGRDPGLIALVRRDNGLSRMLDIQPVAWADIDTVFAGIAGVPIHELA